MNGTLARILRVYVSENQENWDLKLCNAVYVNDTTVHVSTTFSSFQIVYGIDSRSPVSVSQITPVSRDEIVRQIRELLENPSQRQKLY